jgi:ABC-type transport system involved in multi-copper enzyme maturation permease subunit
MSDGAPQGMDPAWFTLMAAGEPLVIAGLALWLAPLTFARSFDRFEGGGAASGRRKAAGGWMRRVFGHRPPLGDEQNPFEWQEKGIGTVALRWSVWLVYAVFLLIILAFHQEMGRERFLFEPGFFIAIAAIAAAVMTLSAGVYGVDAFAREKERRTVEALLLTGNKPSKFYRGKLKAAYVALRWPLLSLAGVLILALLIGSRSDSTIEPVIVIALCSVLGPALAAVIGMAFGAAARTRGHAVGAIICAPVLASLLGIPIQIAQSVFVQVMGSFDATGVPFSVPMAAGALIVILAVLRFTRNWTVWRLSLMLAAMGQLAVVALDMSWRVGINRDSSYLFLTVVVIALAAGLFWYWLGVKLFDRCMLNLVDQPGKK